MGYRLKCVKTCHCNEKQNKTRQVTVKEFSLTWTAIGCRKFKETFPPECKMPKSYTVRLTQTPKHARRSYAVRLTQTPKPTAKINSLNYVWWMQSDRF